MFRVPYKLALGSVALLLPHCIAWAQISFQGNWSAGPTAIKVSIQSWGPDCGRKPTSEVIPSAGEIKITQSGYHLSIDTRDGVIRTDGCWTKNPAVRRVSSSYLEGEWTINCRTSTDDPKEEFGEYSLRAQGTDRLDYKEVNRYNWKLNDSNCVATVITTQTLTRVQKGATATTLKATSSKKAPALAVPVEVKTEPAGKCVPGAPSTLIVRPQRVTIAPGQRVCLRAALLDAKRCDVPNPSVEWSLRHLKTLHGQLEGGCFRAADSAAESEGEYRVVASSGTLSAQAQITVRAADLSDLIARQIEGGGIHGSAEANQNSADPQTLGKLATSAVRISEKNSQLQILVGASILILSLSAILLVLITRRRRAERNLAIPLAETTGQGLTRVARVWPPKKAQESPTQGEAHVMSGSKWICPTCRRAYPAEEKRCPHDYTLLVPYDEFAKAHKAQQATGPRKRCPKCGATFSDTTAFCPQDGIVLESIKE
jgi:hypothetical protein